MNTADVFAGLVRPPVDRPGTAVRKQVDHAVSARQREYALRRNAKLAPVPNPWGLTWMQGEVLRLRGDGHLPREIGPLLNIGQKTVEAHVLAAKKKIGASNTLHAAVLWDRHLREVAHA